MVIISLLSLLLISNFVIRMDDLFSQFNLEMVASDMHGDFSYGIGLYLGVIATLGLLIAGIWQMTKHPEKTIENREEEQMFCSGCGNEVKSDDNFCPKCSKKL